MFHTGFYRGQYKNGERSGYGTRSSSGYEQAREAVDSPFKARTLQLAKLHHRPTVANIFPATKPSAVKKMSEGHSADNIHEIQNWSQIYEGQWANDKRSGYGILKVSDHYTYYGEWKDNMRTGYGVLVYEDPTSKKKEIRKEGRWKDGKLEEEAAKPSRNLLKNMRTELRGKVDEAHHEAIKAATEAREKSKIAEMKANAASAKSKVAEARATDARQHAIAASKEVEKAIEISQQVSGDSQQIKGNVKNGIPFMSIKHPGEHYF